MPVLHYVFGSLLFHRVCTGCQCRCAMQNHHGLCSRCQATVHQFIAMRRQLRALPLLFQAIHKRQTPRLRAIEPSSEQ